MQMSVYHEQGRDLPIAGEYDVIIAGAGPAGVSAAVMAAETNSTPAGPCSVSMIT